MGSCERHQTVVPAGAQQAWQRSLCAAPRRQTGGGGLAPAHGERARQGALQAACAGRMPPNAWARRMGLTRLSVRGTDKARAVLLWFALAHNMLRAFALRRAAMAAAN